MVLISPRPALDGWVYPAVRARPISLGKVCSVSADPTRSHRDVEREWEVEGQPSTSPVGLTPVITITPTMDSVPCFDASDTSSTGSSDSDRSTSPSHDYHSRPDLHASGNQEHPHFGLYASQSSCTPSQTPTAASMDTRFFRPPSRANSDSMTDPVSLHRLLEQMLHLRRLVHCLDLARQLLYRYNLTALISLSTAPFPADIMHEWETDMNEWWAEMSGVLNAAKARVDVQRHDLNTVWAAHAKAEQAHGKKRLRRLWQHESKPSWLCRAGLEPDRICGLDLFGVGWARHGQPGQGGEAHLIDVPSWVIDVVPEPYGMDEIEEEVWRLECEGRVPVGSLRSFRGGFWKAELGDFG